MVQEPLGAPFATTDYQVMVTHNLGGCQDSSTVHIDVNCGNCFPPIPTITHTTCNGDADGAIHVVPQGINGSPWVYKWYDQNNTLILLPLKWYRILLDLLTCKIIHLT